jgi:hypothetical protein
MSTRRLGVLALTVAFLTALWAGLFVVEQATAPPAHTLADKIIAIEDNMGLFVVNYTNASLLTLLTVATLAGFAVYCWNENPLWSAVAFAFVPIYGLANTLAYLSQVFVVPGLLDLYRHPETAAVAETLLNLTIHNWDGSAVAFVNALAYAVLGIPSILLGVLMYRRGQGLRRGSLLLVLSGVMSMVALIGVGVDSAGLALMSPLGGFVYMVALILLGVNFLRQPQSLIKLSDGGQAWAAVSTMRPGAAPTLSVK